MSTEISLSLHYTASEHIAVDHTHRVALIVCVAQKCLKLLAHKHVYILWLTHLTAANSNGTGELNMTCEQQTTEENDSRRVYRPYSLSLVHRVEMIHLNTYIASRTRPIENGDLHVLCLKKSL